MEQQAPTPRRIRLWPAFVFLLVLVFIIIALPIYEGKRHQRISKELDAAGCIVYFSHMESVPPYSFGGKGETQSTLPEYLDKTGLSFSVRRIDRVIIVDSADLQTALPLLESIRELESVSFYRYGIWGSDLAKTVSQLRVKNLSIGRASLPTTNLPWLDIDGLTYLNVSWTDFSNLAIDDLPESLEYLYAPGTLINDDGLDSFVRLKNLTWLFLYYTPCTKDGIDELQKKMPWCKIEWEPWIRPL